MTCVLGSTGFDVEGAAPLAPLGSHSPEQPNEDQRPHRLHNKTLLFRFLAFVRLAGRYRPVGVEQRLLKRLATDWLIAIVLHGTAPYGRATDGPVIVIFDGRTSHRSTANRPVIIILDGRTSDRRTANGFVVIILHCRAPDRSAADGFVIVILRPGHTQRQCQHHQKSKYVS